MKKELRGVLTAVLAGCVFATALSAKVLYRFDFSTLPDGDAEQMLKRRGFEFLLDSVALHPRIEKGKLVISTDKAIAGLFGVRLTKAPIAAKRVKIVWGVKRFPEGADWRHGKNRLALGGIIVFGKKKFGSGVPFAPKAPYFIGPFIGEKEKPGKSYVGKLYKKTGRYLCVANTTGRVETVLDLHKAFKRFFGKKKVPPVTAYAFQMNTKNCKGGAEAFVESVTFYDE